MMSTGSENENKTQEPASKCPEDGTSGDHPALESAVFQEEINSTAEIQNKDPENIQDQTNTTDGDIEKSPKKVEDSPPGNSNEWKISPVRHVTFKETDFAYTTITKKCKTARPKLDTSAQSHCSVVQDESIFDNFPNEGCDLVAVPSTSKNKQTHNKKSSKPVITEHNKSAITDCATEPTINQMEMEASSSIPDNITTCNSENPNALCKTELVVVLERIACNPWQFVYVDKNGCLSASFDVKEDMNPFVVQNESVLLANEGLDNKINECSTTVVSTPKGKKTNKRKRNTTTKRSRQYKLSPSRNTEAGCTAKLVGKHERISDKTLQSVDAEETVSSSASVDVERNIDTIVVEYFVKEDNKYQTSEFDKQEETNNTPEIKGAAHETVSSSAIVDTKEEINPIAAGCLVKEELDYKENRDPTSVPFKKRFELIGHNKRAFEYCTKKRVSDQLDIRASTSTSDNTKKRKLSHIANTEVGCTSEFIVARERISDKSLKSMQMEEEVCSSPLIDVEGVSNQSFLQNESYLHSYETERLDSKINIDSMAVPSTSKEAFDHSKSKKTNKKEKKTTKKILIKSKFSPCKNTEAECTDEVAIGHKKINENPLQFIHMQGSCSSALINVKGDNPLITPKESMLDNFTKKGLHGKNNKNLTSVPSTSKEGFDHSKKENTNKKQRKRITKPVINQNSTAEPSTSKEGFDNSKNKTNKKTITKPVINDHSNNKKTYKKKEKTITKPVINAATQAYLDSFVAYNKRAFEEFAKSSSNKNTKGACKAELAVQVEKKAFATSSIDREEQSNACLMQNEVLFNQPLEEGMSGKKIKDTTAVPSTSKKGLGHSKNKSTNKKTKKPITKPVIDAAAQEQINSFVRFNRLTFQDCVNKLGKNQLQIASTSSKSDKSNNSKLSSGKNTEGGYTAELVVELENINHNALQSMHMEATRLPSPPGRKKKQINPFVMQNEALFNQLLEEGLYGYKNKKTNNTNIEVSKILSATVTEGGQDIDGNALQVMQAKKSTKTHNEAAEAVPEGESTPMIPSEEIDGEYGDEIVVVEIICNEDMQEIVSDSAQYILNEGGTTVSEPHEDIGGNTLQVAEVEETATTHNRTAEAMSQGESRRCAEVNREIEENENINRNTVHFTQAEESNTTNTATQHIGANTLTFMQAERMISRAERDRENVSEPIQANRIKSEPEEDEEDEEDKQYGEEPNVVVNMYSYPRFYANFFPIFKSIYRTICVAEENARLFEVYRIISIYRLEHIIFNVNQYVDVLDNVLNSVDVMDFNIQQLITQIMTHEEWNFKETAVAFMVMLSHLFRIYTSFSKIFYKSTVIFCRATAAMDYRLSNRALYLVNLVSPTKALHLERILKGNPPLADRK